MIRGASVVGVAVLLAACGGKKSPSGRADAGSVPLGAAADATPPVDAVDVKVPTVHGPISKTTRAEYHQRLRAGRKLAKAARWAESIVEFEAALEAIPGDDRALGELAWAGFSAGDYVKAEAAGRASVRAATDPKIKAASLYNLGRVAEATGKPAVAAGHYQASLLLRPNQTVERRLHGLGAEADVKPDPLPCRTPMTESALCQCLEATVTWSEPNASRARCELSAAGATDFKIATYPVSDVGETNVLLVTRQPRGWMVIAPLTSTYSPGMMGISEEWSQGETRELTLGDKRVVQFFVAKTRTDVDIGIDELETEETESTVVCVRGDGPAETTCPLDVITSYTYMRDRLGASEIAEMTELADLRTKGLPIRSELKVSVELLSEGIARVRAVSGRTNSSHVGDRRLW